MTSLDQSFQKAYAKGRPASSSFANEGVTHSAGEMAYSPYQGQEPPAAEPVDDLYTPGYSVPAADFRLQSPDWLAGNRPVAPPQIYPPVMEVPVPAPPMAQPPIAATPPVAAPSAPKLQIVAVERPATSPPPPAPAAETAVRAMPVSISLSGSVTTPSAEPAPPKEEPKQLRVEGKQAVAAPHFGRAARQASTIKPREAAPVVPPKQESWPALPKFDPIWEVDRLEWPVILDSLFSPERDAWQGLMDQIGQRVSLGKNLLAVAGCSPGDGATTLALGIARAAAQRGMRVALIDANTEAPQLGETLKLQAQIGWEQALLGEKTLSETAVASLGDNIHVFPLGPDCAASDVPWEDAVAEAFPLLATRHHLVVVDLGTLAGEEANSPGMNRLVSSSAGLALLVRDGRHSGPARAAAARRQLAAAGLELLGVVENYT